VTKSQQKRGTGFPEFVSITCKVKNFAFIVRLLPDDSGINNITTRWSSRNHHHHHHHDLQTNYYFGFWKFLIDSMSSSFLFFSFFTSSSEAISKPIIITTFEFSGRFCVYFSRPHPHHTCCEEIGFCFGFFSPPTSTEINRNTRTWGLFFLLLISTKIVTNRNAGTDNIMR